MFVARVWSTGRVISAARAVLPDGYECNGCGAPVLLRRGEVYAPHFAHRSPSPGCPDYEPGASGASDLWDGVDPGKALRVALVDGKVTVSTRERVVRLAIEVDMGVVVRRASPTYSIRPYQPRSRIALVFAPSLGGARLAAGECVFGGESYLVLLRPGTEPPDSFARAGTCANGNWVAWAVDLPDSPPGAVEAFLDGVAGVHVLPARVTWPGPSAVRASDAGLLHVAVRSRYVGAADLLISSDAPQLRVSADALEVRWDESAPSSSAARAHLAFTSATALPVPGETELHFRGDQLVAVDLALAGPLGPAGRPEAPGPARLLVRLSLRPDIAPAPRAQPGGPRLRPRAVARPMPFRHACAACGRQTDWLPVTDAAWWILEARCTACGSVDRLIPTAEETRRSLPDSVDRARWCGAVSARSLAEFTPLPPVATSGHAVAHPLLGSGIVSHYGPGHVDVLFWDGVERFRR